MEIKKTFVVGMGLMGSGIAQVCAQGGYRTYVYDISPEVTRKGMQAIENNLTGRVKKGRMTEEEKGAVLDRISVVESMKEASDADLAIEAVFEKLELKQEVFKELDKALKREAILASNTSALPATPMAAATDRPDKFLIIHFHQPPVVMRLVELVRAIQTSDETARIAKEFCKKIGKDVVEIKTDYPGFLTNRTMMPLLNEVYYCLYHKIATKEEIDLAFKSGFNWPMGPLELSDFIGLDTVLHILEDLNRRCGGDKFQPCPLLSNMVAAGYYGRKSGKGFYEY